MAREIDKTKIEKQAKEILDKFAKALEKVEKEKGEIESYVDREDFEREEGKGEESQENFKKMFLENTPKNDDDFVIAEKGEWK